MNKAIKRAAAAVWNSPELRAVARAAGEAALRAAHAQLSARLSALDGGDQGRSADDGDGDRLAQGGHAGRQVSDAGHRHASRAA